MGCRKKRASHEAGGALCDGWIPYMYTPEQLRESVATINRFAKENSRDVSYFRPGLFIFSAVYKSRDEARQVAAERLGRNYAQDFSRLVDRYALYGTPEDCQKRLQEYMDAGAQTVLFPLACRQEDMPENIRLLAKEVIPAFR
jgi:alkanesulfonate monooxygenase SsuD/methylene tetrahydromethanopterin reductase-like flavin-dependent oxidoreductase (luciferase family)